MSNWEKRFHPLRQEWIIYAAHRNTRPWTTGTQSAKQELLPAYDPTCYLCPGNLRVHGDTNPFYEDIYIFDNDHPVVAANAPDVPETDETGLYQKGPARGIARVVCYSPEHNKVLAELPVERIKWFFVAWRAQMIDLTAKPDIKHVLIFENSGKAVGVSNPHPHGQIYAVDFIFNDTARLLHNLSDEHTKGHDVFADILHAEQTDGRRILCETDLAIAFVPYFAAYAYEVMIFPKRRVQTLIDCTDDELADLATCLKTVLMGYNKITGSPFPYVLTLQQAPVDEGDYSLYHMHILLQPPMRAPGLLKYLGGPESGTRTFMADTMPEDKAAELRSLIAQSN